MRMLNDNVRPRECRVQNISSTRASYGWPVAVGPCVGLYMNRWPLFSSGLWRTLDISLMHGRSSRGKAICL